MLMFTNKTNKFSHEWLKDFDRFEICIQVYLLLGFQPLLLVHWS